MNNIDNTKNNNNDDYNNNKVITIMKERFKTMLPINLSFPMFNISSALVNCLKLPVVLTFMVILYIMSVEQFLVPRFLIFKDL